MKVFRNNTKIQEHGCVVLAHMALNDLDTMTDVSKCTMYIISSMQTTVGCTLHSTAMVSITALCVDAFSYNSKLSQVHKVNQDNFSNAGIIVLMLSLLNDYAKSYSTWAMKVLTNVISGLDSVC